MQMYANEAANRFNQRRNRITAVPALEEESLPPISISKLIQKKIDSNQKKKIIIKKVKYNRKRFHVNVRK